MSETKLMALREAVNLAMSEEMRKDENIFLMGEDVGIYGMFILVTKKIRILCKLNVKLLRLSFLP